MDNKQHALNLKLAFVLGALAFGDVDALAQNRKDLYDKLEKDGYGRDLDWLYVVEAFDRGAKAGKDENDFQERT